MHQLDPYSLHSYYTRNVHRGRGGEGKWKVEREGNFIILCWSNSPWICMATTSHCRGLFYRRFGYLTMTNSWNAEMRTHVSLDLLEIHQKYIYSQNFTHKYQNLEMSQLTNKYCGTQTFREFNSLLLKSVDLMYTLFSSCRSQSPCGLRRRWVRTLPGHDCLFLLNFVCCLVEVCVSGWSLVLPTVVHRCVWSRNLKNE